MDAHRCRFVPFPASEINTLAFSHPADPLRATPINLRLAIGRSSGDIEIWNPSGGRWAQEIILRGGSDRSIEGLAWTHDLEAEDYEGRKTPGKLRLFSIGLSNVVTEWDLALGNPLRHSGGSYGEVWCIAAQPRWTKDSLTEKSEQLIALGCVDGSIVLHTTADEDLVYLRMFARTSAKKPRVLCLAWQNRTRIVAGCSDSTIRAFDIVGKGKQVGNMTLGGGRKGKPLAVLIWTVKCSAQNNTIISGDSTGEIKIWNADNYTLLQRLESHTADILDLAISVDGLTMLSGGMDRKTAMYHRSTTKTKSDKGQWEKAFHKRVHQNDVKAMASFESKDLSIVVSGGNQCHLVLRECPSDLPQDLILNR